VIPTLRKNPRAAQSVDVDLIDPTPEPPTSYVDPDSRAISPAKGQAYNSEDEGEVPDDDLFEQPARAPKGSRKRGGGTGRKRQQVEPTGSARDTNEAVANPEENLQPLKPAEKSEAEPFIALAGEAPVQRFFHPKSAAARVQGIRELSELIRSTKPAQHAGLYGRYCHMMRWALRDDVRVIGVFTAALTELMTLTDRLKLTSDTIKAALEPHLPAIIKRLGDKKQQLAKAANDFVFWAADHRALQVAAVAPHLLAPLKAPISWPNVDEKLNLIQELLERYGTVDASFEYGQILSFVFVTLESKSENVRKRACAVCRTMAQMGAGQQIVKMLQGTTVSPQTRQMVNTALAK
jgi:hypothetical protein